MAAGVERAGAADQPLEAAREGLVADRDRDEHESAGLAAPMEDGKQQDGEGAQDEDASQHGGHLHRGHDAGRIVRAGPAGGGGVGGETGGLHEDEEREEDPQPQGGPEEGGAVARGGQEPVDGKHARHEQDPEDGFQPGHRRGAEHAPCMDAQAKGCCMCPCLKSPPRVGEAWATS
jgi:hypothetical protein